jgi:hypothetical protein
MIHILFLKQVTHCVVGRFKAFEDDCDEEVQEYEWDYKVE